MSKMMAAFAIALAAFAGLLGCTTGGEQATPTTQGPSLGTSLGTTELFRDLADRGIESTEAERVLGPVSGCLDDQLARRFELSDGSILHTFVYPDAGAASEAAEQVPPYADCGAIDYAYDIRHFLYGELIVLHGDRRNEVTDVVKALEELSGTPFACAPGPGVNDESMCVE